jgi:DNA-directed RNA polymerase II subunit RPB1
MGDTIIGVQFGIANPADIISRSVVEVITDKTFQSEKPVPGGVFDARFGVSDHGKVCPTCKYTNLLCPGHFGHILLARPVYLYQFIETIQKLLVVICLSCSKPYLPKEDLELIGTHKNGIERFDKIRDATAYYKTHSLKESKTCIYCNSRTIKKVSRVEGTITLQAHSFDDDAEPMKLQPEIVLRCFQRITDADVELIGFNPKFSRPDWMICSVLAVPPLTVRPSVVMDDNTRMEDDLTHKLITIIRNNTRLRDQLDKGASADIIDNSTQLLQFDVATYIDNEIKGMPPSAQRSGRPLKTLKSRFGSKSGRIRGNLMGKRVDFSARSVITPDPNIDVDHLGVPEEIAINLTFPEIVTQYNRDRLMKAIENGPLKYPGAKNVELKHENIKKRLGYVSKEMISLKEGDIVHRHLVDEDVVLFNRQPSLHKASMMCHRIKVLPGSTFRLNVSATKPYNADFDGDEMNMHVPQSIAAATELMIIANLLRQIISPRNCQAIIAVFQDTLTGSYNLTQESTLVPEHLAMNMLARSHRHPKEFKRLDAPLKGSEIMSHAFPLVNIDSKIKVVQGQLVKGTLDDGASKSIRKVVHIIYNDFGHEVAGDFINSVQNIVTKYNMFSGFSTGPSDLTVSEETYKNIAATILKGEQRVAQVLSDVHSGKFLNLNGRAPGEELENAIRDALKEDITSKINSTLVDALSPKNRMIIMSDKGSGSKGKADLNLMQMVAMLGQQEVDGKRIKYMMDSRTLPHFPKYDDGLESRGFVKNSFISGIEPAEFFFHAMGGREGLIDTAVKTSETGYIQRRLVKLLEDIHVSEDRTVRDINDSIVQFSYGDDNIDAIEIEKQECELGIMSMEQVYSMFAASREDFTNVSPETKEAQDLIEDILNDRQMLVKHVFKFINITDIQCPVNMKRLIDKYKNPYLVKTDLTPEYVCLELNKLFKMQFIEDNKLFHCLVRYYLAPKKSIIQYRFTVALFDELIKEIKFKYKKALIHPGEMVGPLAAQSIGEPTTQLTLNTFHTAGTSKANATQGVPRIQELLSVSANPKSPSNTIYLKGEITEQQNAHSAMKEIQKTTLRDITKSVRIYYDPNPLSSNTLVQEDREILRSYEKFSVTNGHTCVSPWIMRLELDSQQMISRDILDMVKIRTKIEANKILKVYDCVHSDTNSADKLILRITFGLDIAKNALALRFIEEKLLDTILTGIDGIGRVFPREEMNELVYDERIGGYASVKQWILETEGSNLLDLMTFKNIDSSKTFSNDIHEIQDVFGIEAARLALYEELMKVFDAGGSGSLNYRHPCLLVDAMTYHGYLIAIARFGMSKLENGVLAKSSFEMTSKVLFDAAVSGEFDSMKGVSANIMFGQKPPCGTGLVDILIDETRLPEGHDIEDTYEAELEHANKLVKDDGHCSLEDIVMAW